ncbi:MAG: DsbA family protein [Acidobacteria bacterium]|nr:DsbA family protein [Acidobacteriota bacterium]
MISLGCSAQLPPQELAQRIERQLRVTYSVPPTVKLALSSPHPSEFPNYDTLSVTFEGDGQKNTYEFLISKDQKTLLRMTRMDLSKDPYLEVMKKISTEGRPVRGNASAKVKVISYDDLQCPYCADMHKTLFPALLNEYGDRVAFLYKDFPLDGHPWAIHAAVDANCLGAQNSDAYWDFVDYVHAHRDVVSAQKGLENQFAALDHTALADADKFKLDNSKLDSCLKAQKAETVMQSLKEGDALGVNGTPTVFVNGQKLDGVRPISEIRAVLDSALEQAGVPLPSSRARPASAAASERSDDPKIPR